MEIERLIPLLEAIELLNNLDGNDNVMLLELVNALAVVQSNVGVENKSFSACHRTATEAACIEYCPSSGLSR